MTGATLTTATATQQHHYQLFDFLRRDASPARDADEALRMNSQLPKQDFDPSPSSCPGLEYLDIPAPNDMRYSQDSNNSPLTLEQPTQPSPVINLYPSGPTSVFNPTSAYTPETGGSFYTPASHVFSTLDVRSRLGSNTSTTGMAHAHRATALPHPAAAHISTRDIYSPATPSFRRGPEHTPRSPSFPGNLRRTHVSPTPSPNLGFTPPIAASLRMDPTGYGSKSQQNIPPLLPMTQLGTLTYADATSGGQPIKIDINGTIDKGFFLADNEWTCYRRNYFSCVCSYNVVPYYPTSIMQWTDSSSQQTYRVYGFAMSISALVADSDGHTIELVQHTPKRDKGPIAPPDKVRLNPKPPQSQHHPLGHFGQPDMGLAGSSRMYEQNSAYGGQQGSLPLEHTFERIQFKQATANNGKRRAAQQYYHLMVELYADVGSSQGNEQYKKIAFRKSEKMIVRGRSPGHYQSERRGSTSSGPGGSAGSLGGFGGSQVMGGDYGPPTSTLLGGGYTGAYDSRNTGHYRSHHELPGEPILTPDETKAISETKDYQYYPATIYENNQDPRQQQVEMYPSQRSDTGNSLPHLSTGLDYSSKTKSEYEPALPPLFYPGQTYHQRGCGRFEGKSSSGGYYPAMMPPPSSSGMNMT